MYHALIHEQGNYLDVKHDILEKNVFFFKCLPISTPGA